MALATPLRLLFLAAAAPARPPDPAGHSLTTHHAVPSRRGHLRASIPSASPAARNGALGGGARPTVLVTEKLGPAGLDLLREFANVDCSYELSAEELRAKVSLVDALVVRSATRVTREVFEAARGRLRVVGRAGVGIDNVDLQAATEAGCLVVNAPTANTVAAAEHAVALLAAMARNVAQADASLKAGTYEPFLLAREEMCARRCSSIRTTDFFWNHDKVVAVAETLCTCSCSRECRSFEMPLRFHHFADRCTLLSFFS